MTRWEYKTVTVNCTGWLGAKLSTDELDQILTNLGDSGWELVTIVPFGHSGATEFIAATLKRPAQY